KIRPSNDCEAHTWCECGLPTKLRISRTTNNCYRESSNEISPPRSLSLSPLRGLYTTPIRSLADGHSRSRETPPSSFFRSLFLQIFFTNQTPHH
ncbi:hypothetical protein LINPERHAP2_LOCUS44064, partial [Linum perenne]